MYPWLVCVTVLVAVVTLLYLRNSLKEGFAVLDLQSQGNVFLNQIKFNDKQSRYYHDRIDKGIITNDGLDLGLLNSAFYNPDLDLPNSPDRDYRTYLIDDPQNGYTDQDKKFCRYARQPRDLPPAVKGSSVACGWWFHPTQASIGVLGTKAAPVIVDGLPRGGTWMWDRAEAQQKEDFKVCKRIRSCDVAISERFRGRCGFCARLSYGVPIRTDGGEKYPNSQLEETCGETVYTTDAQCNPPKPPVIIADDGTPCGTAGRPSSDNSRRLYTKQECDDLGGNFNADGTCYKDDGSSYSYDCRGLNAPLSGSGGSGICKPDANGKLTRECLSFLAMGVGYSKSGGIVRMILTGRAPSENEVLALKICRNAGVDINRELLGGGAIDKDSAITAYAALFELITTGSTKMIRGSSALLCTGTEEFDICDFEDTDKGPYPVECLQKAWRQAGCQPAGKGMPNDSTLGNYASMTWKAVVASFTEAYNAMSAKEPKQQDEAMKQCLGTQYDRKNSNCYVQTPGGYDNGTGQAWCFWATREQADKYCDDTPNCRGYSFQNNASPYGYGYGCLKTGEFTSFTRDNTYTGYTKQNLFQKRSLDRKWTDVLDAGQWQQWGGHLKTISVGSDGMVYGTNRGDYIYWSASPGGTWRDEVGRLSQISTRGAGSRMTVGFNSAGDIYLWLYRGGGWERIGRYAMWVSVGADGTIWCISTNQTIWQYNGSVDNWSQIPGSLVMCSVVNRNDVWGVNVNDDIYHWDGSAWTWIPGKLVDIAASENGSKVVGVNRAGKVFYRKDNGWFNFPGLVSRMAVSNDAVVCTQGPYGNDDIYIMNFS